jgi:FkbM family methyltransferase
MNKLPNKYSLALYSWLLRVRPAQIGDFVKSLLRIRRRIIEDETRRKFWIDPASVFGLELMHGKIYEPGLTHIILTLLKPGHTFLDIGGNEGYYSVLAAGCVGESGQVHCFEPQRRLQEVLHKNSQLNSCLNLRIHCLALADKPGEAQLYLRPSLNTGASSLTPYWRLGRRHETVATTSLDEFFGSAGLDRVRLVKVDCEGAESLVIAGAGGVLSRRAVDFWALEYHPVICGTERCAAIHETLLANGYGCATVCGHRVYYLREREEELKDVGQTRLDCGWQDG